MSSISVVIPAYNAARFLAESLDSMFAQTEPPLEVIVVDDGSTDDTPAVLATYGTRVRVVAGGHGGLSAARNVGIAAARGDWIAFHDADDVALPDRLAFHRACVDAEPGWDATFANGERMAGGGWAGGRLIAPTLVRRCAGKRLDAMDLFVGFPVYFQAALVRRAAFAAAGPFATDTGVQPDLDYAYRLFSRCRVTFVDRIVFRYRVHDANMSRSALRMREDVAVVLERLPERSPESVRLIGRRRLNARLARHYYRIARKRLVLGDRDAARAAVGRAVRLRPLDLRYQLLRLRAAR